MTDDDLKALRRYAIDVPRLAEVLTDAAAASILVVGVLSERRDALQAELDTLGPPQRAPDEARALQEEIDRLDADIETLRGVLPAARLFNEEA